VSVKKIVGTLLSVNILQFVIGLAIWIVLRSYILGEINIYLYLTMGLMLLSNLITILGLYFASRYKNNNIEESIRNLEALNTTLRAQRHDYLNHIQVIYGLLELKEYDEAKKYLDPVFKDIIKVSKALKTAQPAVNALLQAKLEVSEKNGIDMFLDVHSDLKHITIEPWNLCKVLANIIDNAITALAGIKNEKRINIEIGELDNYYTFSICNNGPMIPGNQLEDIFKQDFSTKKEAGHGMGLFIVSKIVKEAGGSINAKSSEEKTEFIIDIPRKLISH
jgi:sensor histidine kinase regulating citrate/malate metabolism